MGRSAGVPRADVEAIESSDGPAWLTHEQEAAIRFVCERAGVEFIPENGGGAGVRLQKGEP